MSNKRVDVAQKMLAKKALSDALEAVGLGVIGFVSVMVLGLLVSAGIAVALPVVGPWITFILLIGLVVGFVYLGLYLMKRLEAWR